MIRSSLIVALFLGSCTVTDQPLHTNRLAKEKSPYLLQHARNPVEWYAWGEEAFEKARREEKPIFLSIGYSTCHWCHVMEKESFEDSGVASLLNQHFVPLKVDREERPDVDALYMQAVMQMTGQGGWPLSVFLTPDLKPFYGGTYFPPEDRWGQPGFKSLLRGVADAWASRREEILQSSQAMVEALAGQQGMLSAGQADLTDETLKNAVEEYAGTYDAEHGGFLPAPKFPRSHCLSFLLRYWKRTGGRDALGMVEETLRAMASGGMYDHLGGGFHRYSTDAQWFLPHFEKMLYDQALLAWTYLEAYQVTGSKEYARTAREIFDYVLREMTDPGGAFYSAEDADSPTAGGEKREGSFYVWSWEEIELLLGPEEAKVFGSLYGLRPEGNVQQDPMGEFRGKNLLHLTRSPEPEIEQRIQRAKQKLFEVRLRRPRPHLDDKVLVDWNGLMISSLALGAQVLEEPRYAQAARHAADFILERLVLKEGRLLHRYRDGEAAIPAHLEDYAFFIHGLVDLYQAVFEPRYLAEAKRLTEEMIRLFWDQQRGGFFLTGSDAEQLLVRQKEIYDGAIPSGNSVAALDLLRVGRLTAQPKWEEKGRQLFRNFGTQVNQHPSAYPFLLIAFDFALGPSNEIVIAGSPTAAETGRMIQEIFRPFVPNKVVLLHPPAEAGRSIEELAPFVRGQGMQEGKPTAYLCRNYTCQRPTHRLEDLRQILQE